jgi:nitroreductase
MDLLQKLNWRYATKEFDSSKKIPAETLENLLEALRLAPSSFGLQPWKFVVVENAELRQKLRAAAWNQGQITDASHVIVLCRKEGFGASDIEAFIKATAEARGQNVEDLAGYKQMMEGALLPRSAEQLAVWSSEQIYLALGVLLTACAAQDVDACPMEGFDPAQFDQILDLPAQGLRSVVVCAVGYRSENDKYASAAKVRFSKEEVIVRL